MRYLKYITYTTCTALLLAGCSNNSTYTGEEASSSNETVSKADDYITESDLSDFAEEISYTDKQVTLLAQTGAISDCDEFIAGISETVEYPLLADIPMEEAYLRWQQLPEVDNTPKYGLVTNLHLDPDELYEIVNKNTDAKLAAEGLHGRTKLNEEDMRFCCEYICKALNEELPEHPYKNQLDDIDANIANLVMYEGLGLNNAAILDDGSMEFSRTMSENMIWVSGFEDSPKKTIAHETQHLIQKTSIEHCTAMGLERSYGFMAVWEDMDIDPLFYNWLIESSAERLAANLYDTEPETYLSKVAYLDSMSFVSILNGYSPESLAESTQQPELDVVFDMFSCRTEDEKIELLYLLYANEVIQEEPEEFMTAYSDKLGHEISDDELIEMKIELKVSLLETLSRYFYRYLAQLTATEKLTFEEVCFLISGWEMDVNSHISYTDASRTDIVMPFLEYYTAIQEAFFEELSKAMKADKDALAELYNIYYSNVPANQYLSIFEEYNEPWKNVEIGIFDAETNKFINSFFEGVSSHKGTAAAEYYNSLNS